MKGIWDFSTSNMSQISKKMKGDPLAINFSPEKNSHNAETNSKVGPFSRPSIVCNAKKGKNILILFARPNGSI